MTSTTLTRLSLLTIFAALPALTSCFGAIRGATRSATSTVSRSPSTVTGAARTGVASASSAGGAVTGVVRSAVAIPKGWTEKKWKKERAKAKEESKSLETWDGERAKLNNAGTPCAAMPMKASDVEPRVAFILDDLLLTELFNSGFQAIGPDDINDMIGFETMKDELGSEDTSNLSELGNTLGVTYLTAGSVAQLEGSTVITLKIINVETKVVVARVSAMGEGEIRQLPKLIAEAVTHLVKRSGL